MKHEDYIETFYEYATVTNTGMQVLDQSFISEGQEVLDIDCLRRHLRQEGYRTKVDASGDIVYAIPKRTEWHWYFIG